VLETLRNVTTTPRDKVKAFSFKGSGKSYSKLFDATERLLSWDNIAFMSRAVSTPQGTACRAGSPICGRAFAHGMGGAAGSCRL
jgi:hypothetical protein